MADGYLATEDLGLIRQLEKNVESAARQCEVAGFAQQKAHADKRAAEAELRAAQAEYHGTIMKMLWKYKLENVDSIRQSDGFIMKGDNDGGARGNVENAGNDTGNEGAEDKGDG